MMIKLKYASFLMFFAIATMLFSCDDGITCDPATELTGTGWWHYKYGGTNYRSVYRFNSCGSGTYSIQNNNGSYWVDVSGMPLEGNYECENGRCDFFIGDSNYGFEYTYSGGVLVITNSFLYDEDEGTWTPL